MIAVKRGVTPAQVAINWTFQQPGITTSLVGAKRPGQAEANAAAGTWLLTDAELKTITAAIDTHVTGK
jgi:methylglyoxal reductase